MLGHCISLSLKLQSWNSIANIYYYSNEFSCVIERKIEKCKILSYFPFTLFVSINFIAKFTFRNDVWLIKIWA